MLVRRKLDLSCIESIHLNKPLALVKKYGIENTIIGLILHDGSR